MVNNDSGDKKMRDFGESDKKKKSRRIQVPENPANLSSEMLAKLEDMVKASLHDGNLPCGIAFKIATTAGDPRNAVGERTDKLGIRVSNCQIGCFKVDKIIHTEAGDRAIDESILARLENLRDENELTCANVHGLARELKLTPMAVADVANARGMKIHNCQLGCF